MTSLIPGAALLSGTPLLDEITDAAGGARRWEELTRIDLGFELGGGLWAQLGATSTCHTCSDVPTCAWSNSSRGPRSARTPSGSRRTGGAWR